jgi:hypothetical protein
VSGSRVNGWGDCTEDQGIFYLDVSLFLEGCMFPQADDGPKFMGLEEGAKFNQNFLRNILF